MPSNYNYFRDYSPGTGRYIESDPLGLKAGLSTFGYAGAAPLTTVDKDGRWAGALGAVGFGICAAASFKMASNAYPGPGDDKKKHCYASCVLNKCTLFTFWPSFGTGFGFEVAQGAAGIGHYDPKDVDANLYGIIVSYKGDCRLQCDVCPIR